MPHGTVRIGDMEITALCDMAPPFLETFAEAFPTIPPERHAEIRARYPTAFDGPDHWVFHDHCFLVRTPSKVILFDTGIGGPTALGAQWFDIVGSLPAELEAAGAAPEDVDVVAISHAHVDHIGWNLELPGDGATDAKPRFPNARYALQRGDWEAFATIDDEGDREAFEQCLHPLESLGVLGLVDGDERLASGATLRHAPGHTPGHQVLVLDSGDQRAVLSGDLANHPAQTADPSWRSGADMEPDRAAATRAAWFDDIERSESMLCTAHYPEPFGRLRRDDGLRVWSPDPPPVPPGR
jgi:glyoxylase-like metal-dependent hydrolase (beta-lactamase superfamily II)